MSILLTVVSLMYLVSAACYVIGLHMMRTPKTARNGNRVSGVGMIIAVIMTLLVAISQKEVAGKKLTSYRKIDQEFYN